MGDRTSIEWTDATWNPIRARNINGTGWYCEHVSEGCRNCYAEAMNAWRGTGLAFHPTSRRGARHENEAAAELFLDDKLITQPLRWKRPRMVFVCSMTDLFADFVPDAWIDHLFAVMALCPQHTFQVLTKRSARMREYLSAPDVAHRIYSIACDEALWGDLNVVLIAPGIDPALAPPGPQIHLGTWPLPNVWLGVSAEDQKAADSRIPDLLQTPAAVRFVSYEPALGPVDFTRICLLPQKPGSIRPGIHIDVLAGKFVESGCDYIGDWDVNGPYPDGMPRRRLNWIIAGGESGSHARPAHPDWFRSVRDQCQAAGVAFLFKQWGEWAPAAVEHIPTPVSRHVFVGNDGAVIHPPRFDEVERDDRSAHPRQFKLMLRVGKKRAGRLLDGVEHNGMPKVMR